MYKVLILISAFALIILATVTIILVKLNWSEKLYSPLLSLGLAGTVTTFITVLLMLKGSETETNFTTLVAIDSRDYLIPNTHYPTDIGIGNAMTEYFFLTHPEFTVDNYQGKSFETPKNDTEATLFNLELVQYGIFKSILGFTNETKSLSFDINKGVSGEFKKPYKMKEIVTKPLKELKTELSKNRFSNCPAELFSIEHLKYKFPKGTKVEFKRIPTSPKTGPEKQVIILSKEYYFKIEIIIEAGLASVGPNSDPKILKIDTENARYCHTYLYNITIKTTFEKITGGNWRTEELKNWASWLSNNIENKYSIN
ncbi:hypothetical protein IVB69_02180 [Flavobacterium sp. J49]|uniref:hypothetical protein n=1 Tax=Flavobacterium sp. J49 TaxID=2718534 RepID=UPI001593002C|nr:hypothetical protein [Flavobacterium sp. J49]MBF6640280.1 hypothetical protein [Flavobacterium sp. J49]NIC01525.1 hypothetical protein [Flavobacterium sp. J49]